MLNFFDLGNIKLLYFAYISVVVYISSKCSHKLISPMTLSCWQKYMPLISRKLWKERKICRRRK